jgi:hypothetical protein
LNFSPIPFIFWPTCHLLVNASSLKLWWPITTTFCIPYTATWKHIMSSLWINTLDLIFWMFCIHSPLKLVVLTPCHFPYTPFVDCANTFVDYVNTSIDCTDTLVDYAHTSDDCANTSIDVVDTPNTPTSNFCIPNSSFYISWSILF